MRKTLFYISARYAFSISTLLLASTAHAEQDTSNDLIGTYHDHSGGLDVSTKHLPLIQPRIGEQLPRLPVLDQGYTISSYTYTLPGLPSDLQGNRPLNTGTITRVYPTEQGAPASDILRFWGVPPRQ
jgi:hypothetical protein